MIAMPVTMMLGSILSGYILALDGLWNLKGWQWLFLLEGLPSVVLGVVTWFFLNDTPDQATWLDDDEKQALKTMIAREQEVAIAHRHAALDAARSADPGGAALHAGLLLPDQHAERDQHLDAADPAKL
jgi:MFS family permease